MGRGSGGGGRSVSGRLLSANRRQELALIDQEASLRRELAENLQGDYNALLELSTRSALAQTERDLRNVESAIRLSGGPTRRSVADLERRLNNELALRARLTTQAAIDQVEARIAQLRTQVAEARRQFTRTGGRPR